MNGRRAHPGRLAGLLLAGAWLLARPGSAALVSHWRLDDGSGLVAADSGGTNPGSLSAGGLAWSGTGAAGGALSFTGGQVTIPAAALGAIEPGDRVSVSLWIHPSSFAASYNTVFDTASRQLSLWIETPGSGWVGVGGVTNGGIVYSPVWTLGEWQHLALTYDATTIRLFRNGVACGTVTQPGGTFSQAWIVGGNPSGGGSPWAGLIDDIQLYSQTLTPADVLVLYGNPGQPLPEPGTGVLLAVPALAALARRRARPSPHSGD